MTPGVHVVMPDGVRDPARPSGGNVYDVRVCDGLAARGWPVREVEAPGAWPHPDRADLARLAALVAEVPDGAVVLVDGLVGSAAPEELESLAARARLVLLVHMPLADEREARALAAADAVVVTSRWTRRWLVDAYRLDPATVRVAVPGTDPAPLSPGSVDGQRLLAVGPVSRGKGHDTLTAALDAVDEPWRLELVGSLAVDRATADRVERWAAEQDGRVRVSGALTASALAAAYERADLLVHPSRDETFGMVVIEALARGIPAVASDVGGTREAVGMGRNGMPGLLVRPGDAGELAAALQTWLTGPDLRSRLRSAAAERRPGLPTWAGTVDAVEAVVRSPRLMGAHR
jgi:glycosyltransferase involved in cell wall biosynthesis